MKIKGMVDVSEVLNDFPDAPKPRITGFSCHPMHSDGYELPPEMAEQFTLITGIGVNHPRLSPGGVLIRRDAGRHLA